MGISIGLVGLGAFGSAFANLFKSHPLVDRVALCDREPERIAKFADDPSFNDKFNPSDAYASLDDICKVDLDALVIITQPWLHAPQCVQAMESGKHVYSAVPIITVPDNQEILEHCDRLVGTVRKTGRHYMLGETTYYHADTMYCRRKAAENAFGGFVYCEGEYYHDFAEPACDLRKVRQQRMNSAAGREWAELSKKYKQRGLHGGPMHYPTHSTCGPICVMNAHAVKVSCYGLHAHTDDDFFNREAFANQTALFQMSNGATMRINEFREIGHTGQETFRIFGTKASYGDGFWRDYASNVKLNEDQIRDPLPEEVQQAFGFSDGASKAYGGHGGSHPYLVHEFVDAVAHDRSPAINIYQAVRYMAAGVAAHESALRDGERVDVVDWGDGS